MATPMSYIGPDKFMCCQCFGSFPLEEACWSWYPVKPHWTRTDVCGDCRTGEIYWMIRKFASYGDNTPNNDQT